MCRRRRSFVGGVVFAAVILVLVLVVLGIIIIVLLVGLILERKPPPSSRAGSLAHTPQANTRRSRFAAPPQVRRTCWRGCLTWTRRVASLLPRYRTGSQSQPNLAFSTCRSCISVLSVRFVCFHGGAFRGDYYHVACRSVTRLFLFLSLSLARSLSLSVFLARSLALLHSPSLFHPLALSLCLSSHSLTLSLYHSLPHSLSLSQESVPRTLVRAALALRRVWR